MHVTAGVVITAGILTASLFALKNNSKMRQQALMRLRVGAQAMTVLAVVASLGVQERQKALGVYRRKFLMIHKFVNRSAVQASRFHASTKSMESRP